MARKQALYGISKLLAILISFYIRGRSDKVIFGSLLSGLCAFSVARRVILSIACSKIDKMNQSVGIIPMALLYYRLS